MEAQKKRGRPPKSETVVAERRRRKGGIGELSKRLAVSPELLDSNYEYAWIVDSGSRIHEKYSEDWDIVSKDGGSAGTDIGNAISVHSGRDENNGAQRQYLMRKPKALYEADKDAAQRLLDEQMNQLKNPLHGSGDGISGSEYRGSAYIPKGGINIK